MDEYLATTSENLRSNNYASITLVIGNESCDLDSAVSALSYAAFLYWYHNQIKCRVCTRNYRNESEYKDDIYVAVMNINKEDYPLKTEVKYLFNEYGIDDGLLVFRDDIDLEAISREHKVTVVLVDHHIPCRRDQILIPHVTEIIDHRPIDQENWRYKEDTRSTTSIVGSCSTLVTQRIIDQFSLLKPKDLPFLKMFPQVVALLRATIILDTVNFSKEVDKGTAHDKDMLEYLEKVMEIGNVDEDRKATLDKLLSARKDVSALTAGQLLRKDLKVVSDVLMPSFPILVEEFLQKPEALKAVSEALALRKCKTALLLGMCLQNGLRRDGALYGENVEQILNFLKEWNKPSLQLSIKDIPLLDNTGCVYFEQQYLSASRKQYIAALNEYFQSL